jgi:hypothetical protein
MKKLPILFLMMVTLGFSQGVTVIQGTDNPKNSRAVINDNFAYLNGKQIISPGAPTVACNAINVGTLYMRSDAGVVAGTEYVCSKTGATTYSWEGPFNPTGGGGGTVVGGGTGYLISFVGQTSPFVVTAATHGQGNIVTTQCYDASNNQVFCQNSVNTTNGTVTFTWNTAPNHAIIQGGGTGSTGGGGGQPVLSVAPQTGKFIDSFSAGVPNQRALVSADIPNNAANTTGNAATASSLAATPTLCGSGQSPTGVLSNGNATGCQAVGGGGGGTAVLPYPTVAFTSSSVLTLFPNCTAPAGCNIGYGQISVLTGPLTLAPPSGSGSIYIYATPSSNCIISSTTTVTGLPTGCFFQSGGNFPNIGETKIAKADFTSGAWSSTAGSITNYQPATATAYQEACGTGLACSTSSGVHTTSVDSTYIPQKFFGSTVPGSIVGNLPGDLYSDTVGHNEYWCAAPASIVAPACTSVSVGGWTKLNGGGSGTTVDICAVACFVTPFGENDNGSNITPTGGNHVVRMWQFTLQGTATFGHLGFWSASNGIGNGGTADIRWAIYATAAGGGPGAQLFVAPPVTVFNGHTYVTWTSPIQLTPGSYYLAATTSDATNTLIYHESNAVYLRSSAGVPSIRAGDCSNLSTGAGGTLTFPATCGTLTGGAIAEPYIGLID